jgi:anti-anti-sigma factor
MELEVVAKTDEWTLLALKGRLDTAGVDQVEARFSSALARARHGVIDLSGVSFLASLGVRMLLTAAKMLARRGATLTLVAPQELVHEALRFSSIDEILPVMPDLAAARRHLGLAP